MGSGIFCSSFLSLSRALIRQLVNGRGTEGNRELWFPLALFWAIVQIVTVIACPGMKMPMHYLLVFVALGLIPLSTAMLLPDFLGRRKVH